MATDDVNVKPTSVPMSPGAMARRGFFGRTFGKLEKGGVRASTFSLCSAAIGGGVLSLPYMFCIVGWGMAYILLIVSALSGVWSNLILVDLAMKYKQPNYDHICKLAGGKCLQKTLGIMILLYVFGACVGFQIMLSTLVGYFANTAGLDQDFIDTIEFRAMVNFPMAICFLIPISLLRDITALAFASMLSLGSLTYTCILMYVELPWYNKEYRAKPDFYAAPFIIDWNFFTAASMCFFAFTCQM